MYTASVLLLDAAILFLETMRVLPRTRKHTLTHTHTIVGNANQGGRKKIVAE